MFRMLAIFSLMLFFTATLISSIPLPADVQSRALESVHSSSLLPHEDSASQTHENDETVPNERGSEYKHQRSSSLTDTITASSPNTSMSPPTMTSSVNSALYTLQPGSKWGPSDISNVLFGIITSVLGAFALGLTYWLSRRHHQRQQSGTAFKPLTRISLTMFRLVHTSTVTERNLDSNIPDDANGLQLLDLPPTYTVVDDAPTHLESNGTTVATPTSAHIDDD